MRKWEYLFYLVLASDVQKECNRLGLECWELVEVRRGFSQYELVFKRPLPADQTL